MTKNDFVAMTFQFLEGLAKSLNLENGPETTNAPAGRVNITDYHPHWDEEHNGVFVPLINVVIDLHNIGGKGKEYKWDEAMKLAQKDGKRMFSKQETRVIAYFIDEINAILEAHGGEKLSGWYWTCDEYIPEDKKASSEYNAGYAWGVYFSGGGVDYYGKFSIFYVRAVAAI